jgi:NAD(P)-dependent dehydrogenase (short-subunit alcohol dehydrogenase family)
MGRLEGKVAAITGAGGGMGREAALLFTGEGARVCVADIAFDAAQETVALCAGEAFAYEVDVAEEEQVAALMRAFAERFGGSTCSTTTRGSRLLTTRASSRRRSRRGTVCSP